MNREEGAHSLSHVFDPFLTGSTPSTAGVCPFGKKKDRSTSFWRWVLFRIPETVNPWLLSFGFGFDELSFYWLKKLLSKLHLLGKGRGPGSVRYGRSFLGWDRWYLSYLYKMQSRHAVNCCKYWKRIQLGWGGDLIWARMWYLARLVQYSRMYILVILEEIPFCVQISFVFYCFKVACFFHINRISSTSDLNSWIVCFYQ